MLMTKIYLCRRYATSWLVYCARPLLASCLMLIATVSHGQNLSSSGVVFGSIAGGSNSLNPGDEMGGKSDTAAVHSQSDQNSEDDWVHKWLRTVDRTRTEQPHYDHQSQHSHPSGPGRIH